MRSVNWDKCLDALEHRTGMYVADPYYPSAVGLIVGFDLARPTRLLSGFQRWMSERHHSGPVVFWAVALTEHIGRPQAPEYYRSQDVEHDEQVRAVRHLCGLIRQYLSGQPCGAGPEEEAAMSPHPLNIDDIDVAGLLVTTDPIAAVPLPGDGPHMAERVRIPLETWQRLEAEAAARGVEPKELIAQLVEAAMSPELQRAIAQLAQRTPPAA